MTEPDEALQWAREQSVQFWESLAAKGLPPETVAAHAALARSGGYDCDLENEAEGRRNWLEGYRAGQAASAERIKALKEEIDALQELAGNLQVRMSDMLTRLEERYPEDFVWLKEASREP
jgi:hypothetical protein